MRSEKDDDTRGRLEMQRYDRRDLSPSTYIEYFGHEASEEVHLRDYLNVILKRKRMVLISLICVVITTLILTFMMTPLYKSTAVVRIESESPNVLAFKDVQGINSGPDYYQTQCEILKSQSLAERVIRNLTLDKNQNIVPIESLVTTETKFIFNNTVGLLSRL